MNRKSVFTLATLVLNLPALAHHSNAALDMDALFEVEGTISEFSMVNPHSYFVIATTDGDGEAVDYEVQMASALTISRRGWTRDALTPGDRVRVGVRPSRSGRPYGLLEWIEINGVRRDSDIVAGRGSAPAASEAPTTESIEGTWIVDRASLGDDYPGGLDELTSGLALTAPGRTAADAYSQDSIENPELSCVSKPTPSLIVYTDLYPLRIEMDEGADVITIRSQYFDTERTVYMDGRAHPPADQRFHEGHSTGSWDDGTLVIDTTNFTDHRSPYQNGIPGGAQKHVVERYTLLDNGTHMRVEFFLEDPEFIVGSLTHARELVYSPDLQMTPFDCDLESTRRFLPD